LPWFQCQGSGNRMTMLFICGMCGGHDSVHLEWCTMRGVTATVPVPVIGTWPWSPPIMPSISDADIERIAQRVAQLLTKSTTEGSWSCDLTWRSGSGPALPCRHGYRYRCQHAQDKSS
jgi:hypothetical protein